MYSRIPMPSFDWKEKNMRYAICFFPVVGLIIGAAEYLWMYLGKISGISGVCIGLIYTAIPLIITGGIHADGFIDTQDALQSFEGKEKKLEILKDPHVGAFGIIRYVLYLLLYAAAAVEAVMRGADREMILLCISFAESRILSGMAAVSMPNARGSGMLYAFAGDGDRYQLRMIFAAEVAVLVIISVFICPVGTVSMWIAGIAMDIYYKYMSNKNFGGITGDLEG
jgi:adenosylcobinamide-GDP ribazoletransferase